MKLSTPLKTLSQISLIAFCSFLTACGGSDTTIIEKDSIPIEDDHDHEEATPATKGRLLIADKDAAKVSIWEIAEKQSLAEYTLSDVASAVYASPTYRYGIITQRNVDKVNVIDSGLFQEDHGDHMDDEVESPMLLNFATNDSRPTHYVKTPNILQFL
ncbi:MAG: hypothetical protein IPK77_03905 [Cellvibrio sp.]|nr:hypothetical protein [Cellvibrio sp.]